jgi:hypothetical protein
MPNTHQANIMLPKSKGLKNFNAVCPTSSGNKGVVKQPG